MKLSIYLFRTDCPDFDHCIRPRYLNGPQALDEVEPEPELPYDAKAFILSIPPRTPRWSSFLSSHFALDDLQNQAYGFILLLRAANRIFAVTFGYGHQAVEASQLEPNFGLITCANSIAPDKVRTIDSRNIDIVTRQQRTHLSAAGTVPEFGIAINRDWVRFLSGAPIDVAIAKSMSGADSFKISAEIVLTNLADKCAGLLDLYQSNAYKTHFGFLDHFRPLSHDDLLVGALNAELAQRIAARSENHLSLANPSIPDEERLSHYKIHVGRDAIEVDELTLTGVYDYLAARADIDSPLTRVRIIGLDDAGEACTKEYPLFEYITGEIDLYGKKFMLSAGSWFEVANEYAASIRHRLNQFDDVTDALAMPAIVPGETEGVYNARVAEQNGWFLFDKKNVYLEEAYQRVEVCDLLAPANRLICVKKMTKSATLSHLFAQGAVSAELLKWHAGYRQQLTQMIEAHAGNANLDDPVPVFVFAVATEKRGPLAEELFLFSAINLATQAEFIQRCGYRVALAKIRYH